MKTGLCMFASRLGAFHGDLQDFVLLMFARETRDLILDVTSVTASKFSVLLLMTNADVREKHARVLMLRKQPLAVASAPVKLK